MFLLEQETQDVPVEMIHTLLIKCLRHNTDDQSQNSHLVFIYLPSTPPPQSPGHSFGEKEFREINQFSLTMKFDTTQT